GDDDVAGLEVLGEGPTETCYSESVEPALSQATRGTRAPPGPESRPDDDTPGQPATHRTRLQPQRRAHHEPRPRCLASMVLYGHAAPPRYLPSALRGKTSRYRW